MAVGSGAASQPLEIQVHHQRSPRQALALPSVA